MELAVKAIGNPLPDIVWLKNSDIISPHKHPHIKSVSLYHFFHSVAFSKSSWIHLCIYIFQYRWN